MIDLLRTRRSIRKYRDEAVDPRSLEIIKEALLRCPSSRGINHRTFVFVDDRELLLGLSKARQNASKFIGEAAFGIVVCGDETKSDVWVEDCAIAGIVAQLTAQSLGLGSCWIQVRKRAYSAEITAEEYIQSLLNIPPNLKILCMISIGAPAEVKSPIPIEGLDYTKIK